MTEKQRFEFINWSKVRLLYERCKRLNVTLTIRTGDEDGYWIFHTDSLAESECFESPDECSFRVALYCTNCFLDSIEFTEQKEYHLLNDEFHMPGGWRTAGNEFKNQVLVKKSRGK